MFTTEILPIRCDECRTVISSKQKTLKNPNDDCLIKQISIDCKNETINIMYWCPTCEQCYVLGVYIDRLWKKMIGNQLKYVHKKTKGNGADND